MQFFSTHSGTLSIVRTRTFSHTAAIGGFALLTAVGAQIAIPTVPVPFTLQTVFVLLSGAVLGARRGAAAQLAYLAMGAAGLPVFAGFSGTFVHLLGPTGGYLLAFPLAAFATGFLFEKLRALPRFAAALVSMTAAMALVFAIGVSYLNLMYMHDWNAAFTAGFLHLQVWDAVKIVSAAGIASAARRSA
ncbi:MAG: biotin transporter BioY [Ignavibacteriae bacterium]|nr:biotin transporter BioY [Ignavibacteriota bacterium]